jgi:hypothetical protein
LLKRYVKDETLLLFITFIIEGSSFAGEKEHKEKQGGSFLTNCRLVNIYNIILKI